MNEKVLIFPPACIHSTIRIIILTMRNNSGRGVISVEKAMDLLFLFADHPTLGVREISQQLNAPPSTTYRFVQTLQNKGVLEQDKATRRYSLGPQIFALAAAAMRRLSVRTISLPHMHALAASSKETVQLMLLRGFGTLCLEVLDSPEDLRVSPPPGRRLPLHAGALAKVMLAFLPEPEITRYLQMQPLQAFTADTITNPKRLRDDLACIRKQGYAVSRQEVYLGAAGVAAPIFNADNNAVASLGVSAPLVRLTPKRVLEIAPDVVRHAREISTVLGQL
jgi:DNA-binding IclR family transcriptional regulator